MPRKRDGRPTRAERLSGARRLAALVKRARPGDDALAPPAFISERTAAHSLAVWRELVPELRRRGVFETIDRMMFALFCYWYGVFVEAKVDIDQRGAYFMVPSTGGTPRPWANPSVRSRDTAFANMLALSGRFALTPIDRYALFRGQKDYPGEELFGPVARPAAGVGEGGGGEEAERPDSWADLLPGAETRPN